MEKIVRKIVEISLRLPLAPPLESFHFGQSFKKIARKNRSKVVEEAVQKQIVSIGGWRKGERGEQFFHNFHRKVERNGKSWRVNTAEG